VDQMRAPVTTVGHAPVITATAAMSLREAARLMHTHSIGALGVLGENGLVAVLSERDLLDALAAGADPDTATVGEHMSTTMIAARPHDTVLDVALLMLEDGIRHVPVVDEYGRDTAMVSLRDLLRPLVLESMTHAPG
jgi:CBS domain-containing protein